MGIPQGKSYSIRLSESVSGSNGNLFSLLCEKEWITTEDQGRIKRYRISETGITRLNQVESQLKGLAASAG